MWNNNWQIIGNVGNDPEVRFTQSGMTVSNFSVALSNGKDKQGNYRDSTWIHVIAFDRTAEQVAEGIVKGSQVMCNGKFQLNKWTDKNGAEKSTPEMILDNFGIVPRNKNTQQQAPAEQPNGFDSMGSQSNEDIPF